MEQRLNEKLKYLIEMLGKYDQLNKKTNYEYLWRSRALENEIKALEELRDKDINTWDECYEEDLQN